MVTQSDRFPRWQTILIAQLTYALNLFLALTVAALAYWFQLLRDKDFQPTSTARPWLLIGALALALGTLYGLVCVLTRLLDFRGTAQRARANPQSQEKATLDEIGRVTWRLFYGQIAGFAIGIGAIAIALLETYGGKLT
jgi:hypothetical protein